MTCLPQELQHWRISLQQRLGLDKKVKLRDDRFREFPSNCFITTSIRKEYQHHAFDKSELLGDAQNQTCIEKEHKYTSAEKDRRKQEGGRGTKYVPYCWMGSLSST